MMSSKTIVIDNKHNNNPTQIHVTQCWPSIAITVVGGTVIAVITYFCTHFENFPPELPSEHLAAFQIM